MKRIQLTNAVSVFDLLELAVEIWALQMSLLDSRSLWIELWVIVEANPSQTTEEYVD